jgi:hypothetical protein
MVECGGILSAYRYIAYYHCECGWTSPVRDGITKEEARKNAYASAIFREKGLHRKASECAKGEWERVVEKNEKNTFVYWRCTVCKKVHFLEPPRAEYCQGCGARMKGWEGSE